jgi:hypothetical protein
MTTAPKGGQGWRKSSYSGSNGNSSCVEVNWHKSSHSGSNGNSDCVEVAVGAEVVGVRDSKNAVGPQLAFGEGMWRRFLNQL